MNIDSNQTQEIRKHFRKTKLGFMIVGKNSVIRKGLSLRINGVQESDKDFLDLRSHPKMPQLQPLLELLKGKVGLVFTEESVPEFRKGIASKPIPREAKVGATSPIDVILPAGPTGLAPSEVNFFHNLGLLVKINKSILDLQKEVHILKKGQKVGGSEAILLKKLNMKPFTFNLDILHVFDDGKVLPKEVFDITQEEIIAKFQKGASYLAGLSLAVGRPNELSAPLMIQKSFSYLLAVGLSANHDFKELKEAKTGGAGGAPKGGAPKKDEGKKEDKKEAPKAVVVEEKKEEQVEDLGGFFDF